MKDNNKKIIIAIIAVATIIVAIIGATFAFFSASGGSTNNAVTANATTLTNLGFTSSHSKIATNLVPVSSESPYFSRYPGIAASGEHSCLDDLGNQICSIYEFTVTNTASVAQTIYVSFVPSENTFDNMYFAAFNTSIASANYVVATGSNGSGNTFILTPQTTSGNSTLGHQATKLTKNNTSPIDMPGSSTTLSAGSSVTYTILVWLQETGSDQNTEQGGVFKAGVNVTTGGNSTGVTGVMGGDFTPTYSGTIYRYSNIVLSIGESIKKWCAVVSSMNLNSCIQNEYYNARFNSKTECESAINSISSNSNATPEQLALAQAASCESQYLSYETNPANLNNPFYLKHVVVNDIVTESYVVFEITPSISSANSGMTVGTYELKGGDNGISFLDNAKTVYDAFGGVGCYLDRNPGGNPYTTIPSSTFECIASDLRSDVAHNGFVLAGIDLNSYCTVYEGIYSSCVIP